MPPAVCHSTLRLRSTNDRSHTLSLFLENPTGFPETKLNGAQRTRYLNTWSFTLNNHINTFLEHYINLKISPEYALLLSGEWGSGKTFFINKFLEAQESEKKFIKVSLFGINSIESIDEQIFQQLHPVLSSKPIKITTNLLKSALKFGTKIDWDNDTKPDGNISVNFSQFNIFDKDDKSSKKEIIFIFDDLERINTDLSIILGYINTLVEQLNFKVIILANENKLQKDDVYKDFKEKIIGKTFYVKQDFNSAYNSFIELVNTSKEVLKRNATSIYSIFLMAKYNNLRHIRQTILDFEYFYKEIDQKYKDNEYFIEDLIKIFFALSIELKSGKLNENEFIKHDMVDLMSDSEFQKVSEEKTTTDKILKKYSFINKYDLILTKAQWVNLLNHGILLKNEISKSFKNSKYFLDENQAEWVKLWHFSDLEDQEFNHLLTIVEKKFQNNEYCKHEILLHVSGILLRLSDLKLYNKSKKQIVKQAKKNINNCIDTWKEEYLKNKYHLDFSFGSFSLGFHSNESQEFKSIEEYILKLNQKAIEKSLADSAIELLNSLEKKDYTKFKDMLSLESSQYSLYNLPVFSKVDSINFIDTLIEIPNYDLRRIVLILDERYKHHHFLETLTDELKFWKKIRIELNKKIKTKKGTVKGYLLENFKIHYLDNIINKLKKIIKQSSQ